MANYVCASRTNYFTVNDERKWEEWFGCVCGAEDFTKTDEDGTVWHGFGCYDSPWYSENGDEEDWDGDILCDRSLEKLQDMLPDDQAFVYIEAGNEKLRYVVGYVAVVTNQSLEVVDLASWAYLKAEELLVKQNGPDFEFDRDGFRDNMDY